MKFGQYLAENLTPEWKRAYIDYRGCKKRIKVVANRLAQPRDLPTEGGEERRKEAGDEDEYDRDSSDGDADHGPSAPPRDRNSPGNLKTPRSAGGGSIRGIAGLARIGSRKSARSPGYGATTTSPRPIGRLAQPNPPPLDLGEPSVPDDSQLDKLKHPDRSEAPPAAEAEDGSGPSSPEGSKRRSSDDGGGLISDSGMPLTEAGQANMKSPKLPPKSPRFLNSPRFAPSPKTPRSVQTPRVPPSPQTTRRSMRSMTLPSPRLSARSFRSFSELYDSLDPDCKDFFDFLQHELEKVEGFYHAREGDAIRRAHDLRDQLRELAEHRKIFHELYPNGIPEWEAKVGRILPGAPNGLSLAGAAKSLHLRIPFVNEGDDGPVGRMNGASKGKDKDKVDSSSGDDGELDEARKKRIRDEVAADRDHQKYSPERYQKYKKELRAAVLEFYRQLELIKNYRIMNLTGFRKALKKFEKTAKIHCMEMYTDERIIKESFAHGETIEALLTQTEELYSSHFEHGDSKKARDKLRRQQREKTHYTSVFRTGSLIGLGLPAAIFALFESSRPHTRLAIPAWGPLLQVYGGLYLPVLFALLFELNLEAWVRARINYEFVMEMSRPITDYRSFAEIPSFLFLTLSYCFYFSFYRVGASNVAPTTWPLAWLVFVIVFFINPLPLFRRHARYWLLRVLWRVITPGYSRVEFIAFFLADELNSLVYSIQNIYFMSCAYNENWPSDTFTRCRSGASWPYALMLCIPAVSRLIQCLKRWYDSRLGIHLINAGKYLSTILQLCLFVLWRSRGDHYADYSFPLWVVFAAASAIYTSSWDLIVDWSLLRSGSRLLRPDLGYSSPYVYYFAMVTNVLIRFIWIWYIPFPQSNVRLRSFFFALAEMLRRWQWNFFRVETEHLGNADAYRVTREIPLPYCRVERDSDNDNEDDNDMPGLVGGAGGGSVKRGGSGKGGGGSIKSTPSKFSVHLDRIRKELVGANAKGRGPDALNVGARGRTGQREYEARRPGDVGAGPRSPGGTSGQGQEDV